MTQDLRELTIRLGSEPFLDLVTFRRDGRGVHTPVWAGTDGRQIFVSTWAYSGKVKRARNFPGVALIPCDGPGNILPGADYVMGQCEILDKSEFKPGVRAFKAKYGTQFALMWASRWGFRLLRKRRVWLLVTLTPDVPPPPIAPPAAPAR